MPPPNASPLRPLFVASLGNPKPYHQSRHSAGHILLNAVLAPLAARLPRSGPAPVPYQTWRSPALMNISGTKLVRQLSDWMEAVQPQPQPRETAPEKLSSPRPTPTLVLLHDEMEAPLGEVSVRRGGPEKAGLRGHRGLKSVIESLRGKGLYSPPAERRVSVMRVGVGIGRPESRSPGKVAEYVLEDMHQRELDAVRAAAGPVVDILVDEVYRVDEVD
jgi:PTH1 family peptidyl-tRNA hydrolase